MRILHLIGSPRPNQAKTRLILAQSERVETVVMAAEGAATAEQLLHDGVPVLWRKTRQSVTNLHDAMQVLQPDLVHLHGACDSEALVPLRIFSHRALVLELDATDSDGAGGLRRDLRGLRLDWRCGRAATALCPAGLAIPTAVLRASLPPTLADILTFDLAQVSAAWFIALYRRALLARAADTREHALPGLA